MADIKDFVSALDSTAVYTPVVQVEAPPEPIAPEESFAHGYLSATAGQLQTYMNRPEGRAGFVRDENIQKYELERGWHADDRHKAMLEAAETEADWRFRGSLIDQEREYEQKLDRQTGLAYAGHTIANMLGGMVGSPIEMVLTGAGTAMSLLGRSGATASRMGIAGRATAVGTAVDAGGSVFRQELMQSEVLPATVAFDIATSAVFNIPEIGLATKALYRGKVDRAAFDTTSAKLTSAIDNDEGRAVVEATAAELQSIKDRVVAAAEAEGDEIGKQVWAAAGPFATAKDVDNVVRAMKQQQFDMLDVMVAGSMPEKIEWIRPDRAASNLDSLEAVRLSADYALEKGLAVSPEAAQILNHAYKVWDATVPPELVDFQSKLTAGYAFRQDKLDNYKGIAGWLDSPGLIFQLEKSAVTRMLGSMLVESASGKGKREFSAALDYENTKTRLEHKYIEPLKQTLLNYRSTGDNLKSLFGGAADTDAKFWNEVQLDRLKRRQHVQQKSGTEYISTANEYVQKAGRLLDGLWKDIGDELKRRGHEQGDAILGGGFVGHVPYHVDNAAVRDMMINRPEEFRALRNLLQEQFENKVLKPALDDLAANKDKYVAERLAATPEVAGAAKGEDGRLIAEVKRDLLQLDKGTIKNEVARGDGVEFMKALLYSKRIDPNSRSGFLLQQLLATRQAGENPVVLVLRNADDVEQRSYFAPTQGRGLLSLRTMKMLAPGQDLATAAKFISKEEAEIAIHEFAHARTMERMVAASQGKADAATTAAYKRILDIRDQVAAYVDANKIDIPGVKYALSRDVEFVAQFYNSQEFVEFLKQVPVKKSNAFKEILYEFLDIIGFKGKVGDTAHNHLFDAISEIIETRAPVRSEGVDLAYSQSVNPDAVYEEMRQALIEKATKKATALTDNYMAQISGPAVSRAARELHFANMAKDILTENFAGDAVTDEMAKDFRALISERTQDRTRTELDLVQSTTVNGKEIRLLDFIKTDGLAMVKQGAHHAAGQGALARKQLHDPRMQVAAIDAMKIDGASEQAIEQMQFIIDTLAGNRDPGSNPEAWSALRNMTMAARLGKLSEAILADTTGVVGMLGISALPKVLGSMAAQVITGKAFVKNGGLTEFGKQLAIDAPGTMGMDYRLHTMHNEAAGGEVSSAATGWLSRAASRGAQMVGHLSAANAVNEVMHRAITPMIAEEMITAVSTGASKINAARLADAGLDLQAQATIKKYLDKYDVGRQRGERVNWSKWEGVEGQYAADLMVGAITRATHQTLQKSLLGEKAMWTADTQLGQTVAQFHTYGMTAAEKIAARNFAHNDNNTLLMMTVGLAWASMLYTARVHANASERKKEEREEYIRQRMSGLNLANGVMSMFNASGVLPEFVNLGSVLWGNKESEGGKVETTPRTGGPIAAYGYLADVVEAAGATGNWVRGVEDSSKVMKEWKQTLPGGNSRAIGLLSGD